MSDIVAELDAWLDAWKEPDDTQRIGGMIRASLRRSVQRARDEIVALRATKVLPGWTDALRQTRTQALEEAAQMCFRANPASNPNAMGHAIRALKGKTDD